MNDTTVSMGPTIANPSMLQTPEELRQALERANGDLFAQAQQINTLHISVTELGKILARLCELQLAGKGAQLSAEMELLATHYQKQKAVMAAGRVH